VTTSCFRWSGSWRGTYPTRRIRAMSASSRFSGFVSWPAFVWAVSCLRSGSSCSPAAARTRGECARGLATHSAARSAPAGLHGRVYRWLLGA